MSLVGACHHPFFSTPLSLCLSPRVSLSVGIPSFTEKLANLLESAEEDSQDVRSFLEESRTIRRQ